MFASVRANPFGLAPLEVSAGKAIIESVVMLVADAVAIVVGDALAALNVPATTRMNEKMRGAFTLVISAPLIVSSYLLMC